MDCKYPQSELGPCSGCDSLRTHHQTPVVPYWVRGYDAKLLKKLTEDTKFLLQYDVKFPEPTTEELHRREVTNKWYERRVARVRKVMEAYHISASSLCDCDY